MNESVKTIRVKVCCVPWDVISVFSCKVCSDWKAQFCKSIQENHSAICPYMIFCHGITTIQHDLVLLQVCSWEEIGCPSPFQFFPVPKEGGLNFSSNPSKHDFANHSFEDCGLKHNPPGMSLHLQFSVGLICYKLTSLFICETFLSCKHTECFHKTNLLSLPKIHREINNYCTPNAQVILRKKNIWLFFEGNNTFRTKIQNLKCGFDRALTDSFNTNRFYSYTSYRGGLMVWESLGRTQILGLSSESLSALDDQKAYPQLPSL